MCSKVHKNIVRVLMSSEVDAFIPVLERPIALFVSISSTVQIKMKLSFAFNSCVLRERCRSSSLTSKKDGKISSQFWRTKNVSRLEMSFVHWTL
jgi:hypothetical protein